VPQGYFGNAHARASGKLLLALASDSVRESYLDRRALKRLTPHTITARRALEQEFVAIRDQGYALDQEEFALGLSCVAMSLDRGSSPSVVAVAGPTERVDANRESYLERSRRATGTA
jgi:IclR family acetate operon transcriptional repressor